MERRELGLHTWTQSEARCRSFGAWRIDSVTSQVFLATPRTRLGQSEAAWGWWIDVVATRADRASRRASAVSCTAPLYCRRVWVSDTLIRAVCMVSWAPDRATDSFRAAQCLFVIVQRYWLATGENLVHDVWFVRVLARFLCGLKCSAQLDCVLSLEQILCSVRCGAQRTSPACVHGTLSVLYCICTHPVTCWSVQRTNVDDFTVYTPGLSRSRVTLCTHYRRVLYCSCFSQSCRIADTSYKLWCVLYVCQSLKHFGTCT